MTTTYATETYTAYARLRDQIDQIVAAARRLERRAAELDQEDRDAWPDAVKLASAQAALSEFYAAT